jgi:hypothetical protein
LRLRGLNRPLPEKPQITLINADVFRSVCVNLRHLRLAMGVGGPHVDRYSFFSSSSIGQWSEPKMSA